jgi:hypothetical protein
MGGGIGGSLPAGPTGFSCPASRRFARRSPCCPHWISSIWGWLAPFPPSPASRATIADPAWFGIACRGKERSSGRLSAKVSTALRMALAEVGTAWPVACDAHVDLQSALTSSPPDTPPEMCRAVMHSQIPQFPLCSDGQPLSLLMPWRVGRFNGLGNRGATALAERLQYTPRLRTLKIGCRSCRARSLDSPTRALSFMLCAVPKLLLLTVRLPKLYGLILK